MDDKATFLFFVCKRCEAKSLACQGVEHVKNDLVFRWRCPGCLNDCLASVSMLDLMGVKLITGLNEPVQDKDVHTFSNEDVALLGKMKITLEGST
jgi:hypothetical protein